MAAKILLLAVFSCMLLAQVNLGETAEFLRVQGTNFYYGSSKVFLSGPNLAWYSYSYDFGNGQYNGHARQTYETWVDEIAANGGNSLRFWLHIEGENTPAFDSNGFVTGPDRDGTLIPELATFLDYAASKNVFVIIVLWNGALMRNLNYKNLVLDDSLFGKLDSYINLALRPMVRALANKPALAAWEIMNEPEGSVAIQGNSNRCYDTQMIAQYGAGWTGENVPMESFLRFINWHSAAIRQEDPKALVTLGSWSEHAQSDVFSDTVNYYKDSCLIGAGGRPTGTIDFYQMHTYSWEGNWNTNSPFKRRAEEFGLDKPLIIGEFSADCAMNEGIQYLFDYSYNNSYAGTMPWQYNEGGHCADTRAVQNRGMQQIRYRTDLGLIDIEIQ